MGDWTISPQSSSSEEEERSLGVDVSRGGGMGLLAGGGVIETREATGGELRAASMLIGVPVSACCGGLIKVAVLRCPVVRGTAGAGCIDIDRVCCACASVT